MAYRKHHNNKGLRQIKRGRTREQVARIRKRLGVCDHKFIDSKPCLKCGWNPDV